MTIHAKSSCCGAIIYRFGARRRQCSLCHRTWSIRQKKRGRKSIRVQPSFYNFASPSNESLRHKSKRLKVGREVIRRRHQVNLIHLAKLQLPTLPPGSYICVVDGFTVFFQEEPWTLYLVLVRAVNGELAYVMPPYFRKGVETIRGWELAFEVLSPALISQVKAVVSDGTLGMDRYAKCQGWVLQRCHCHLLRTLYPLLGLRWHKINGKGIRLKAFQEVLVILHSQNQRAVQQAVKRLGIIAHSFECPKRFGLKLRGFLQSYRYFRNYLTYPELNLPNTTNCAENICGQITSLIRRTRSFRSPKSYFRWVIILLKQSPTICCRRAIFNRISVS